VQASLFYDSRFVGSGSAHVLETIAVPGSDADRRAGFYDLVNARGGVTLDLQAPLEGPVEQAQAYVDARIVGSDFDIRQAFLRVNNLLAGLYWTNWGDEGALPRSIMDNTTAAGALYDRRVPQIRLAIPDCGGRLVTSYSIQQPVVRDFTLVDPNDDVRLQRYPDLTARIRYFDGDYNSFSIGGIIRQLGREDINRDEDFVTGWGITAATRFRVGRCRTVQAGCFGGQGVGESAFGLQRTLSAAGPTNTFAAGGRLTVLDNYGGYVGYQRRWSQNVETNFAYGYVQADGTAFMPGESARKGQNAWCNLITRLNDNFAIGLEYHYGQFETLARQRRDNHRFHFVLQLTTSPPENRSSAADRIISSYGSQADGLQDAIRDTLPAMPRGGQSRFRRL